MKEPREGTHGRREIDKSVSCPQGIHDCSLSLSLPRELRFPLSFHSVLAVHADDDDSCLMPFSAGRALHDSFLLSSPSPSVNDERKEPVVDVL